MAPGRDIAGESRDRVATIETALPASMPSISVLSCMIGPGALQAAGVDLL